MWSIPDRKRRRAAVAAVVAAAALLALAGCGFRPLHGRGVAGGDGGPAALSGVRIEPIADRAGQQLRNMLLDRMTPGGAPDVPRYVLKVTLSEQRREIALRKDETATRVTMTLLARFTLNPVGEARTFHGSALSANGYNVLQSEFATLAAERDARERALAQLSEDITLRVAAALYNPAMFGTRAAGAGAR